MNYMILMPLAVGMALLILRAFTSRRGENLPGSESIYKYEAGAVSVMLVMAIILLSVPIWLPYVQPGKDNDIVYIGCAFISTVGLMGCFWLYVFRIKVDEDFVEYGAIFKRKIYFKDIRRVTVAKNDAKGSVIIYPKKGLRVVFSYTLSGYPMLKDELIKRMISSVKLNIGNRFT